MSFHTSIYFVNVLILNSKAVVERRGFRPKIFDDYFLVYSTLLAVSPPYKIVGFRAYMTIDCGLDFLVTRPLLAYLWYYSKPWLLRASSPSIDLRMVSYCPERAESIRVTSFPITIGWTVRMILSTTEQRECLTDSGVSYQPQLC
jgi:hypothetical protein